MIVTLIEGRTNRELEDVYIPEGMTAGEFKRQWLLHLAKETSRQEIDQNSHRYLVEGKQSGGSWFAVPDELTLQGSGLHSGAFVRIQTVYSTVSGQVEEESVVPLFRRADVKEGEGLWDTSIKDLRESNRS
jgi:hypothetical protein